jgi:cathepsin L
MAVIKLGLLFLAALVVDLTTAAAPKWYQLDESYTFDQYVFDFQKEYKKGSAEWNQRESIFSENLRTILRHNRMGKGKGAAHTENGRGSSLFKMGVNHMADWTAAERQALNGAKTHAMYNVKSKPQPTKLYAEDSRGHSNPLPKAVDLRNRVPSIFSAVKDQGHCGSCWSTGAAAQMESYQALANGRLFTLSNQQITSCVQNPAECGGTGGCHGAIVEYAYAYAEAGLAQEWQVPYTAYYGNNSACMNVTRPVVFTEGFVKLPANNQTALMEALAHIGPLAVNVDASQWHFYEAGIFDACTYYMNITINHLVQLVGYGHDEALQADYWIIRNSWSPIFGEQGFIRIYKEKTDRVTCGWDVDAQAGTACKGQPTSLWVCGECGVLWDSSYPVMKK